MILKTYARVLTADLNVTLELFKNLLHCEPDFRVKAGPAEVAVIGDFCICSAPDDILKSWAGSIGPIVVDDLQQMQAALIAAGVEITSPPKAARPGLDQFAIEDMFSKTAEGQKMEWMSVRPEMLSRILKRGSE